MWQRFSEKARKVVFYAQEEAQRFGESYVSTEHLLLGLVRETDSVAAHVLQRLSLSCAQIAAELERQLASTGSKLPVQDMTLTPRAKRVIDLAYDEARHLNNNYIGTEHLLLGLLREADGLAGRMLISLGMELDATRSVVFDTQQAQTDASSPSAPLPRVPPRRKPITESRVGGLWSRFNLEARQTILRAQEQAESYGESYVASEHLLLGLALEPDSRAMKLLERLSLSAGTVSQEIQKWLPKGDAKPSGELTLTPRAKRVIELANQEALALGCDHIGSEHILLGLVAEGDGLAGRILAKLGIREEVLRNLVQETESVKPAEPAVKQSREGPALTEHSGFAFVVYTWQHLDRSLRTAILQAQLEAQLSGLDRIDSTELLLGLLKCPGEPLARTLDLLGHSAEEVLALLEVESRGDNPRLQRKMEFTLNASDAIGHAIAEAGDDVAATPEHLLLALLKFEQDVPARVFAELGVSAEMVRAGLA